VQFRGVARCLSDVACCLTLVFYKAGRSRIPARQEPVCVVDSAKRWIWSVVRLGREGSRGSDVANRCAKENRPGKAMSDRQRSLPGDGGRGSLEETKPHECIYLAKPEKTFGIIGGGLSEVIGAYPAISGDRFRREAHVRRLTALSPVRNRRQIRRIGLYHHPI
jgi:hypothetical protein